jgi:uncharacterized RDD family membrane protein YckC
MTLAARQPLDTLQRMELAEGVEVELHPAGPMVRAVALVLDSLWQALLYTVLGLLMLLLSTLIGVEAGQGVGLLLIFLTNWGYHVYFEAGRRAATPGKRAMGLRVVSESGGPASLGAIMLRNIARTADMMPIGYLTGLLVCLFTRRFQRLGDLVARTLVVYANPGEVHGARVPPPLPGLTPHPPPVALTREERAAVVRFHERAALWSPARREELAGHAAGLTRPVNSPGVQELALMAAWLRDS